MKRIVSLALAFLLGTAPTLQAAYALVVTAQGDAGSNLTTAAVDTTGANLLVLAVMCDPGSTCTPSDSQSNTWTGLTVQNPGASDRFQLWYAAAPIVGTSHTFSVSGANNFACAGMLAFSGAASSAPLDVQSGASTAGATSLATGSITPAQDNEVIVAGWGGRGAATGLAVDSGMTLSIAHDGVGGKSCGVAYKIQTTAAAINATYSWTTSQVAAVTIGSFKAAAAAARGLLLEGVR